MDDSRVKATSLSDVNVTPFHLACLSGDRETCELFLKNGVDIMSKTVVTRHTSLHFAAWEGHEEICNLLIETGDLLLFCN